VETFTLKISFLRQIFGSVEIARDNINVAVSCPACNDTSDKKKLSINVETWNCHCWVCGIKGKNPYKIIKDHIDPAAANTFKDRFRLGGSIEKSLISDIEEEVHLPDGFLPLFVKRKSQDPDIKSCLSYLRSRNVNYNDLWYFKLGTCNTGALRRRIIIPSFDMDGELNYFSARSIDENSRMKYLNSKNKKTDIIFNEINIDWEKDLTLVEGPFDLFKCNQNATCLLGSSLRSESLLFKKIIANKTPVTLALDSDMKKKSMKIAEMLMSYSCNVRILDLGKFHDVGDMSRLDFKMASAEAITWSRKLSMLEKISSIGTGSLL